MSELVSVIIPVYNSAHFLKQSLESVINQTYQNIEIICVNDGSTDNSLEILKSYSDKITIISQENRGLASALNAGIKQMKGKWFKWFSPDDVMYSNTIETLVNTANKFPNTIIYSNWEIINEKGNKLRDFSESNYNELSNFEYNVKVTKETVEMAHKEGVSVEGELGCLGSLETGMGEKEDGVGADGVLSQEQLLTDPEEAANFVNLTHVDALAIAIGTSHGAYKFTRPPTGDILAIKRIKEIHKRIPNTHLVMHGSSSVPQDLLKIINENGGEIKETYGVPVKEIQEGIKHGVRKINIDTDLRLASTAAIRKHFTNDPTQFDPRKYLIETKDAMKKIVMNRLKEFRTAGNADKIKPQSLKIFATKYSLGELTPKII